MNTTGPSPLALGAAEAEAGGVLQPVRGALAMALSPIRLATPSMLMAPRREVSTHRSN